MIRCQSCKKETGSFAPCCAHCGVVVNRPKPPEFVTHYAVRIRMTVDPEKEDFFQGTRTMSNRLRRLLSGEGLKAEIDNLNL